MVDIQSAVAEIRQGKKDRKKNKRQDENIMVCPIPYGDHKYYVRMRSKLTLITAVKYNYPRYRNVNSFQRFSCIFAHDSITRQ